MINGQPSLSSSILCTIYRRISRKQHIQRYWTKLFDATWSIVKLFMGFIGTATWGIPRWRRARLRSLKKINVLKRLTGCWLYDACGCLNVVPINFIRPFIVLVSIVTLCSTKYSVAILRKIIAGLYCLNVHITIRLNCPYRPLYIRSMMNTQEWNPQSWFHKPHIIVITSLWYKTNKFQTSIVDLFALNLHYCIHTYRNIIHLTANRKSSEDKVDGWELFLQKLHVIPLAILRSPLFVNLIKFNGTDLG